MVTNCSKLKARHDPGKQSFLVRAPDQCWVGIKPHSCHRPSTWPTAASKHLAVTWFVTGRVTRVRVPMQSGERHTKADSFTLSSLPESCGWHFFYCMVCGFKPVSLHVYPYSIQSIRQGCCREWKASTTPVLKEQDWNPTMTYNFVFGSDSGTVYLWMNEIIVPCPAQSLGVPAMLLESPGCSWNSHQTAALCSPAHLGKSPPILFFHDIQCDQFMLDQPCSLSCCLLCRAHREQAEGLGNTSSQFCVRCTRSGLTTQGWQRRACGVSGCSLQLELGLAPRVENPVPTLSLRFTRMQCLCAVLL